MKTDPNKLPSLLSKFRQLYRESLEIKQALAEVEREIVAVGAPRRRPAPRGVARAIKTTVDALRAAPRPLTRQEVAAALGVSVGVASVRLGKMVEMQLAERAGRGRYQAVELGNRARRAHAGTPLAQEPHL